MATKRPSKAATPKSKRAVETQRPKATGKPVLKAKPTEASSVKASKPKPKAKARPAVKAKPATQKPKPATSKLASSSRPAKTTARPRKPIKAAGTPKSPTELPPANGKPISNKSQPVVTRLMLSEASSNAASDRATSRIPSKRARTEGEETVCLGLFEAIDNHVQKHQLGRVANNARFDWGMPEDPGLEPDLAYVSHDRWAPYRHVPTNLTWHVVPDLVVEIVRDDVSAAAIQACLDAYFAAGVKRVWVVYPQPLEIHDHQSATDAKVIDRNKAIEGGDLLPGFRLELKSLRS